MGKNIRWRKGTGRSEGEKVTKDREWGKGGVVHPGKPKFSTRRKLLGRAYLNQGVVEKNTKLN